MSARPSPAVYRRRRLVVLLAAIAVVALVWWGIAALVGRSAQPSPAAETTTPAVVQTVEPTTVAPPTTEATPTPTAPIPCTTAEVAVTALTDAGEYGPEAQPQLSLKITNTSAAPCTIDVGTAAQVYTVTSGADTIWTSTDCQSDGSNEVVALQPGQELQAPNIPWVRERSTPDTCEGERPAAVAGGASYELTVSIGGLGSEPTSFILL